MNAYHLTMFMFISPLSLLAGDLVDLPISTVEAEHQIGTAALSRKAAEVELKARTESVPALSQASISGDERSIVLRKVVISLPERSVREVKPDTEAFSAEALRQFREAQVLEPVNLRLSSMVYGGEYSELTLSLGSERYSVWTNVDYTYLPFLGDFETDVRCYTYNGFNYRIDREAELNNATIARLHGYRYESHWKQPPIRFSSEEPEYVVVTEDARTVPDEVYRQLDDLMTYYLARQDALRIEYLNAKELQAARERYKAANPEVPQDIVLNFSRVSEPEGQEAK